MWSGASGRLFGSDGCSKGNDDILHGDAAETSAALSDRTVHATYTGMEVVRYDRSGKWYLEPTNKDLPRQHVGVKTAARMAVWGLMNADGYLPLYESGGSAFDRHVLKLEGA